MRCARTAASQYFKDHFVVLIDENEMKAKREGHCRGTKGMLTLLATHDLAELSSNFNLQVSLV